MPIVFLQLAVPLALLALGFFVGRAKEAKHFRSLEIREHALAHITTNTLKKIPDGFTQSDLVDGNVVISIDYFKRLMAFIRAIFGGRIESYTSLMERARREAVLRMKEEADAKGATMIANVRLDTSSVFQNTHNSIGSLEVYAYGTALK